MVILQEFWRCLLFQPKFLRENSKNKCTLPTSPFGEADDIKNSSRISIPIASSWNWHYIYNSVLISIGKSKLFFFTKIGYWINIFQEFSVSQWPFMARTYLQLPLRQWGAGNVYLLVLSSWKVNIAENPIAVMGL